MKTKELINGNKLIAEFMGAKLNCESGLEVNFHMNEFGYKIGNGDETFNSLKFHKSWDWLIPVINKIYNSDEYIEYKKLLNQFSNGIEINTTYIQVTWADVITYIKWYNTQNK